MTIADTLIEEFDRALRAAAGVHRASRVSPAAGMPEVPLEAAQREEAAALMRVNHAGEICAQALYQSQALTARSPHVRDSLRQAAREEEDHLAWCAQRIEDLDGRTSLLAPLWYAGSFALGAAAGMAGDRWNLAFLAETEHQVEAHLDAHLARLSPQDRRTRAVVSAMRDDESRHRETALSLGAAALPSALREAMRLAAKVMTTLAHRV